MTRLRFAILYLLSSILAATGADVAFYLQSFTGRPVNYPITLTPYAPLAVDSTNLITATTWRLTPSNGVAYASNILAGDYTMSIELTGARAVITVPDTNGLLDAASLVSVNPATATGLAYSKTASDARYVHGVAAGENATASTNAGVVTISAEPGGGWSNILGTAIYAVPGALPWDSEDIAFVGESGTNLVIRWGDGSGIYAPLFTGDGSGLTNLPVTGGSVSNLPPAQSPMWLTSRPRGIRTNTPAWGMKPAMGWNPWNTYYCEVNQGALVGAALAMKTNGLAAAGYTNYIATDDPWQIGRDGSGNPTVDPVKWPNGFPWLRNFLNTNGFGFAVWTSMRTYGQAQSTSCGGSYLHGSGFYEARDAWFYVTNFGVNAIKIDNLGASNMSNSLVYFTSAVEDACNATGREVYLMTVGYGGGLAEDVYWPWAPLVNQARTGHDIRPVWNYEVGSLVGVRQQLRKFDIGAIYHQPGFFNDPDMMVVGVTNTLHGTNAFLSYDENLSHFQLWCIMGAPLMLGCNPTNLSAPLMAIVTNRSLINVDQDSGGFAGRVIFSQQERGGPFEIWSKPAGTLDSGTNYVLLLNNSDTTNWFYAYWAKLGFGTNVTVNDLSQSLSSATRETRSDFTRARLAPRQSIMYRVVSTPARDMSNREWLDNLTLRKDTTNALHVDTLTATNFRGYSHAAFTVGSATTPTVAYVATNHNFTGTITGDGSGLTGLNASALASGTISNRPGIRLVVLGDSLSHPSYASWAYYVAARAELNGITIVTNFSTGGRTASNMLNQFEVQVGPVAPTNTGLETVLAVWAGQNDRNASTPNGIAGYVSNLWESGISAGFKVIGFTITPYTGNTVAVRDGLELVNEKLRANSTNLWRFVDAAAMFANPWQTNVFSDGQHLVDTVDDLLGRHVEWVMTQGDDYRPTFSPGWEARVNKSSGNATNLSAWGKLAVTNINFSGVSTPIRIGDGAGAVTTAAGPVFIGGQAGLAANANYQIGIGQNAMDYATNATGAIGIGYAALIYAPSAFYTVGLGCAAGSAATNMQHGVNIGFAAGAQATAASYSVNLGAYAGRSNSIGARSINIGAFSGTNRADTIWMDTKATVADGSYMPLILGYCDTRLLTINGTLTATNGYFLPTNSLAAWPTAPATPGAAYFGNSNGVVYLLTSGLGNTWTSTNKLGP
jgi:hypothetical protein